MRYESEIWETYEASEELVDGWISTLLFFISFLIVNWSNASSPLLSQKVPVNLVWGFPLLMPISRNPKLPSNWPAT